MTEEKDMFVQEKSQWESPRLESRSIEEETLGEGNKFDTDNFDGGS